MNDVTDQAALWLATARRLSLLCLNRAMVLKDRLPRFSPNDEEYDAEMDKRRIELDLMVSTASMKLKNVETDKVGVPALLGREEVSEGIRNAVAYLAVASIFETFSFEARSVGALMEISAGWHDVEALKLKRAMSLSGILRPHVIYRPSPLIKECVEPCLTEKAVAKLLSLEICSSGFKGNMLVRNKETRR